MRITAQNLGIALANYLESEFASKVSGLDKLMLYVTIPTVSARMPQVVDKYHGYLDMLGVMTPDGMIDLDVAIPLLREAMGKTGKVPLGPYIFDQMDVDRVEAAARPYAQ